MAGTALPGPGSRGGSGECGLAPTQRLYLPRGRGGAAGVLWAGVVAAGGLLLLSPLSQGGTGEGCGKTTTSSSGQLQTAPRIKIPRGLRARPWAAELWVRRRAGGRQPALCPAAAAAGLCHLPPQLFHCPREGLKLVPTRRGVARRDVPPSAPCWPPWCCAGRGFSGEGDVGQAAALERTWELHGVLRADPTPPCPTSPRHGSA